jgi:hypothetical protein
MVITPHVLVGAALARRRSVGAAAALGLVSHYALDAIPHRDYSMEGIAGAGRLVLDAALAGVALRALRADRAQIVGALAALVPDVLAVAGRHGLPTPLHDRLHEATHHESDPDFVSGWAPQVAVSIVLFAALRRSR